MAGRPGRSRLAGDTRIPDWMARAGRTPTARPALMAQRRLEKLSLLKVTLNARCSFTRTLTGSLLHQHPRSSTAMGTGWLGSLSKVSLSTQ